MKICVKICCGGLYGCYDQIKIGWVGVYLLFMPYWDSIYPQLLPFFSIPLVYFTAIADTFKIKP